ncbi:MAG: COP23 domain-containing protein [Cyanobacteria bacterium P01_A01_bin.123]
MSATQRNQGLFRFSSGVLLAGCLASMGIPALAQTEEPTDDSARFACQVQNGEYTVVYLPQSQPGQAYPWAVPDDMGANWPAERRCNTISERLELYRPQGLVEMRTGIENGYNTVCVITEANNTCQIVFTVPQGQDPVATRDQVFENLALADEGQATEGVTTFTGGGGSILDQIGGVLDSGGIGGSQQSNGINLKPFLAPEDGGTATQLNSAPGRPLNPNNF